MNHVSAGKHQVQRREKDVMFGRQVGIKILPSKEIAQVCPPSLLHGARIARNHSIAPPVCFAD